MSRIGRNPIFGNDPGEIPPSFQENEVNILSIIETTLYQLPKTSSYDGKTCEIRAFKTSQKPWKSPLDHIPIDIIKVATDMTMKGLMQKLGCRNHEPTQNVIVELIELGNGRWGKGMKFYGNDSNRMNSTLASFGWDHTRTGESDKNSRIWIWVTDQGM